MEDDLPVDLFDLLTEPLRAGVEDGSMRLVGPGQNDKPVVVDAVTGRWVAGSGRPLGANDSALVGKVHGFKHSKGYVEALEHFIPAEAGGEGAIMSLEELLVAAKKAVIDVTEKHQVICPACDHKHYITIGGKADAKVLTFLIERIVGAAQKTQEINLHSEELVKVLSDTRVLHTLQVVALTPEQRAANIRAIQEAS